MTTTNGVAPHYTAVPDLLDEERLSIIQAQIRQFVPQIYALEAGLAALPKESKQRKDIAADLAHTRETMAGYRALESELLGRLNGGA